MTRRVGMQIKLAAVMLIIGMVPVILSVILIDRITAVAHSFASNEFARVFEPLERAQQAYRELASTTKALHAQIARAAAADPGSLDDDTVRASGLLQATGYDPRGEQAWQERVRDAAAGERRVEVEHPTADGGRVQLAFAVDETLVTEFAALGQILRESGRVQSVRRQLPSSSKTAFGVVVGGFAIILIASGIWLGRGVTRRIDDLVRGFRDVAAGDLSTRVRDDRGDEIGEMARAFNRMVTDLESERRKSAYLQRITTWQDVARKLAHEIKNPLTPIQLAVQQIDSAYAGDDERYRALLSEASEIVKEEIENLRRLVDAFRELGRLPRVNAKPISLVTLVEDLLRDPELANHVEVDSSCDDVVVLGDRLLLRRVIANLVENAVQAGGAPVSIQWIAVDAERVEVVVEDHGSGVPDELVDTLFDPYVTGKETGTGLGLAISKKIAIEHGGALELDPSVESGARFVLTLRRPATTPGSE